MSSDFILEDLRGVYSDPALEEVLRQSRPHIQTPSWAKHGPEGVLFSGEGTPPIGSPNRDRYVHMSTLQ